MTGVAQQTGTIRSNDLLAGQAAIASLRIALAGTKNSIKAGPGTLLAPFAGSGAARLKAGPKGCAKTSDGDDQCVQSAPAAATPVVFVDLMACLLPKIAGAPATVSTNAGDAVGVPGVQTKKVTSISHKAEVGPAVAKAVEDVGAAKMGMDVKVIPAKLELPVEAPVPSASNVPMLGGAPISPLHTAPVVGVKASSADVTLPSTASVHEPRTESHMQGDSKVLAATPGVLEVGVSGGTHGWLRVRAEIGNEGVITASLVTSSASAAEVLHKELPSISAFLASEQVGISSVVVHAAESSAGAQDAAMSLGAGASGQQSQREHRQGQAVAPEVESLLSNFDLPLAGTRQRWGGTGIPLASLVQDGGGWLSVRV